MKDKDIEIFRNIKREMKKHSYRPTCALPYIFALSNTEQASNIIKFVKTIEQHPINSKNSRYVNSPTFLLYNIADYENSKIGIDKIVNMMAMLGCSKSDLQAKTITAKALILRKEDILEEDILLVLLMHCNHTKKHEDKIWDSDVFSLFNSVSPIELKEDNDIELGEPVGISEVRMHYNETEIKETYHFNHLISLEVVNPIYMQLELKTKKWIRLGRI